MATHSCAGRCFARLDGLKNNPSDTTSAELAMICHLHTCFMNLPVYFVELVQLLNLTAKMLLLQRLRMGNAVPTFAGFIYSFWVSPSPADLQQPDCRWVCHV